MTEITVTLDMPHLVAQKQKSSYKVQCVTQRFIVFMVEKPLKQHLVHWTVKVSIETLINNLIGQLEKQTDVSG